jgi:hypothetical protein
MDTNKDYMDASEQNIPETKKTVDTSTAIKDGEKTSERINLIRDAETALAGLPEDVQVKIEKEAALKTEHETSEDSYLTVVAMLADSYKKDIAYQAQAKESNKEYHKAFDEEFSKLTPHQQSTLENLATRLNEAKHETDNTDNIKAAMNEILL